MTREEFLNTTLAFNEKGIFCNGVELMCTWEKNVIQTSVDELCARVKPKRVLEVGYGYGWTAERFQANGVVHHVVVEPHPQIIKTIPRELRAKITLVEGFIENYDSSEEFDLIYNDLLDPSVHLSQQQNIGDFYRFNHFWYAQMFSEARLGAGFMFSADGREWFQPLVKNHFYSALYGGS